MIFQIFQSSAFFDYLGLTSFVPFFIDIWISHCSWLVFYPGDDPVVVPLYSKSLHAKEMGISSSWNYGPLAQVHTLPFLLKINTKFPGLIIVWTNKEKFWSSSKRTSKFRSKKCTLWCLYNLKILRGYPKMFEVLS